MVTFVANPETGSIFLAWGGDASGCGQNLSCSISVGRATTVAATFDMIPIYSVDVSLSGDSTGTVTSDPDGINCGVACAASYPSGTAIELLASPAADSLFTGWEDDGAACDLSLSCSLEVTRPNKVGARFTRIGSAIWLLPITAPGTESVFSAVTDASGDAFVAGIFTDSELRIGDAVASNHGPSGTQDLWLARLSGKDGRPIWLRALGGVGDDQTIRIAIDPASTDLVAYISYRGTADLGGDPVTSGSGTAGFALARYSRVDGHHIWSKMVATNDTTSWFDGRVSVDTSGNTFLVASWKGQLKIGTSELTSLGTHDLLLAKYDALGAPMFARSHGQLGVDVRVNNIDVDLAGRIVVVGFVMGMWTIPPNGQIFTLGGSYDGLIAEFSGTDGSHWWSWNVGGTLFDECLDAAIGPQGDVTAVCVSDIGDGSIPLSYRTNDLVPTLDGATGWEVVVARYEPGLLPAIWSRGFGGAGNQSVSWVGIDYEQGAGRIVLGGTFTDTMSLDSSTVLVADGAGNGWIASLALIDSSVRWGKRFGVSSGGTFKGVIDGTRHRVIAAGGSATSVAFDNQTFVVSGAFDGYVVSLIPRLF